jgi:hypothetical protein
VPRSTLARGMLLDSYWLPSSEVDALRDLADPAARVTARLRSSLDE